MGQTGIDGHRGLKFEQGRFVHSLEIEYSTESEMGVGVSVVDSDGRASSFESGGQYSWPVVGIAVHIGII